jgi:SH3-like domain-containing protein
MTRSRLKIRNLSEAARLAVCVAAACLNVSLAAAAEDEFPYPALVFVETAEVRCGPGDEFYVTGKLKRGVEVEVYRHEANGWMAIRPPAGSFSWIPARSLRGTETPDVAEAAEADVVVWVGTSIESVQRHKWQVELQPGERVEILNRKLLAPFQGAEPETWCMVAPPAGEFRWIHTNAIRPKRMRLTEEELAAHRVAPPTAAPGSPAPPVEAPAGGFGFAGPPPFEVDPTSGSAAPTSASGLPAGPSAGTAVPPSLPPSDVAAGSTTDFTTWTREAMELELARRVTTPMSSWRLNDLVAEIEKRKAETPDPGEAARWDAFLVRTKEFRLLQEKARIAAGGAFSPGSSANGGASAGSPSSGFYGATASAAPQLRAANVPSRVLADPPILNRLFSGEGWTGRDDTASLSALGGRETLGSLSGSATAGSSIPAANYDATGFLMPINRQSENVPPFALVSAEGRILRYVNPTPGLNLHRYVRQEIGVFGATQPAAGLDGGVLTAERVIVLDRHR